METKVLSKKYVEDNYVHKDKLKELKNIIDKEYDKSIIEFMRKKENFVIDGAVAQTLNCVSGKIEELLEESEDK